MRLTSRFGFYGLIAASALPSSPAWADPPTKDCPAESSKAAPSARGDTSASSGDHSAVLGGPKVETPAAGKSLISRDFDGKIKRLEIPPEEAALDLIEIDQQRRDKINTILTERAAMLDKIVADNLLKIVEAHNAQLSGDKSAARKIYAEVIIQAQPLRDRGKLGEEIKTVLTPEMAESYDAIRGEYWNAILQEDIATGQRDIEDQPPPVPGVPPPRGQMKGALRREISNSVGTEIKRSYERQAAARAEDFKTFTEALELSSEQETKVRNILTDDFQATQGKRNLLQNLALLRAINAELSPAQREQLGAYIRDRRAK